MTALAEACGRWRRVYQLALQERTYEADALLAAPFAAVLKADLVGDPAVPYRKLRPVPRRDALRPGASVYALARYGVELGVPELAVPVFDEAEERGERVPEWDARAMRHDLDAVGESGLASQWAARHPTTASTHERPRLLSEQLAVRGKGTSLRARMRLAVEVWKMAPVEGFSRRQQLELLEIMLPPEGRRLAREALLQQSGVSSADRAALLTRLAQGAPPSESYAAWERLSRAPVGSEARAKALMAMADVRLGEGRPQDAVLLLTRARDGDPRVAPDAQWQLAMALFHGGDYAAALDAFRRSEIEIPRHLCCHESYSTDYAIWEGLTLERLGRTSEAIPHYMSAIVDVRVMAHLLDLYESADQFEDLERAIRANTPMHPAAYGEIVPSLELLVMHRMARARDWASVISALQQLSSRGGSQLYDTGSLMLEEAVRLLSRACEETVPLLGDAVESKESRARPWIAYALGRCATPAAVERLRSQGLPDVPAVPYRPTGRHGTAEAEIVFPPVTPTPLPSQPDTADHTPRPYRGPQVEPCICM